MEVGRGCNLRWISRIGSSRCYHQAGSAVEPELLAKNREMSGPPKGAENGYYGETVIESLHFITHAENILISSNNFRD